MNKVTPIPKTNVKSTRLGDWKPMSQIGLPSKLLEKIIRSQLSHYLDVNKILADKKYGFRRGPSTSITIFGVLKQLYENWNDKAYSGCALVDFSRVFDSIDHNILLEKLELYG